MTRYGLRNYFGSCRAGRSGYRWRDVVRSLVEHADNIGRMIVNTFLAPNKTSDELRDMVNSGAIDLLRDFSEACRKEFERFGYT